MVRLSQKGITLIELIITLALVAVIIASIAPLGRSWIATAHVSKAQSVLTQAFNKAKTEALKNPNGILSDATNPTVATITVYPNTSPPKVIVTNSSGTTIWEDSFDQDTTITLPTTCSSIILLNNTVQFLKTSGTTKIVDTNNTCSSYTISASSAQNVYGVLR